MVRIFIPLYLLITLAIGFWASKKIKTSDDFTLAGKSLSTAFVGVTLFATWFGSTTIMGNPTRFAEEGFSAFASLILSSFMCLLIVGRFYARKLYRMNIITVGDFFRKRYNAKLELASSIIMVLSYPHWIAAQLVALAYLFTSIMGIPFAYGIALGAAIVVFYTYIGGMWAVSYTDMLQSIMIVVGLIILLYEILKQTHGIAPLFANQPEGFFSFTPEGGRKEWSAYIALFLAFMAGSIPVQEIYQRVFSAKDERAAKNGVYLAAILLVLVPSIPLVIGLGGVYLHPELLDNPDKEALMPSLVNMFTSLPVQILFYGAMISAILSTSSGAMLAPATVVGENFIKPNMPNISDKRLLLYTRLSVIAVAAISCYFAFNDSDIIGLVEASVSLILVCIFAPFTFGLFWKKASVFGAWTAIILGGLTYFVCTIADTLIDGSICGFVASCLGMVIGSLLPIRFTNHDHDLRVTSYDSRIKNHK